MADSTSIRKPSKADIEIAEIREKYQFRIRIVEAVKLVLVVAFAALPLFVIYKGVHALAGQSTEVNVGIGIAASFAITGVPLGVWLKMRGIKLSKQSVELQRLRERISLLEEERNHLRVEVKRLSPVPTRG